MNTLLISIILLIVFILFSYQEGEKNNFTNNKLIKIKNNITYKENEILLLFFYVDWCKYSQEGIPQWLNVQNEFEGKKIDNYNIKVRSINCEGNELEQFITRELNIHQYPTILVIKNKTIIEYNYEIKPETIKKFIKTKI